MYESCGALELGRPRKKMRVFSLSSAPEFLWMRAACARAIGRSHGGSVQSDHPAHTLHWHFISLSVSNVVVIVVMLVVFALAIALPFPRSREGGTG